MVSINIYIYICKYIYIYTAYMDPIGCEDIFIGISPLYALEPWQGRLANRLRAATLNRARSGSSNNYCLFKVIFYFLRWEIRMKPPFGDFFTFPKHRTCKSETTLKNFLGNKFQHSFFIKICCLGFFRMNEEESEQK